jgi:hypothetical protein
MSAKVDMKRLDALINLTPNHVDRDLLVSIRDALTEQRTMPHELALTIASTITHGAGVTLAAHGVPIATRLAVEVGNNCGQAVLLILEAFLDDGTISAVSR